MYKKRIRAGAKWKDKKVEMQRDCSDTMDTKIPK